MCCNKRGEGHGAAKTERGRGKSKGRECNEKS